MPIGPHRTLDAAGQRRATLEERFDAGAEVTLEALVEKGLIKNTQIDVKLLGHGRPDARSSASPRTPLSASAREKIEAAGGSLTLLREPKERRPKRKPQSARAAARPRAGAGGAARPRPSPTRSRRASPTPSRSPRRTRARCSPGSPTRGACPELRKRVLFTALILALYRLGSWIPAPGRRLRRRSSSYFNGQGGTRARPAERLLGRRALAVLALRARDHAVRHRLDHPAAPDRRHPEARGAPEGRRGRLRQDQPVHALPDRRARGRAGDRLRVPLQAPGRADRELRPPRADRHHAHRRHDAADVDGRADHQARDRQRHLAADLRVDPRRRRPRA